jgi:hypothetical protein
VTKQTKVAAAKIASQMKVATVALKQMKAAVKANDMKAAVVAAKQLSAANDAAEAVGVELTDAQLKGLGNVITNKGLACRLDIPMSVINAMVAEEKNG